MYNGWGAGMGSLEPAVEVDERSFDFSGECVLDRSAASVADDVHGVWLVETGGASGGIWSEVCIVLFVTVFQPVHRKRAKLP